MTLNDALRTLNSYKDLNDSGWQLDPDSTDQLNKVLTDLDTLEKNRHNRRLLGKQVVRRAP